MTFCIGNIFTIFRPLGLKIIVFVFDIYFVHNLFCSIDIRELIYSLFFNFNFYLGNC